MDDRIEKEMIRLKNLPQYKNKTDDYLQEKATLNIKKRESNDIADRFDEPSEKKFATKIYESYLQGYPFIDSVSDLSALADLVYEEVLKARLEKQINSIKRDSNGAHIVPDKQLTTLHDIQNQILSLKTRLGIDRPIKEEDKELTGLQELQKRFHKYIQVNKHEFTTKCSCCGEMLLLRRRVKDFEVLKHPMFSGTWLYNEDMISDVKSGILTKEQAAKYLKTSPDYIDWCIKHKREITKIEDK